MGTRLFHWLKRKNGLCRSSIILLGGLVCVLTILLFCDETFALPFDPKWGVDSERAALSLENRRGPDPIHLLAPVNPNLGLPGGRLEAEGGAGSGNYHLEIPLIDLPGRGVGLSLTLFYNSQIWSQQAQEDGNVGFDIDYDGDWPVPGASIGFGKLVFPNGGMLIEPNGTRRPLSAPEEERVNGVPTGRVTATFTDGSGERVECPRGSDGCKKPGHVVTVTLSNGRHAEFIGKALPNGYSNVYYPHRLFDVHGNFIQIDYTNENTNFPLIDRITDTAGRVVQFHYDSRGLPVAMTGPGENGGTRLYVRFTYRWLDLKVRTRSGYLYPKFFALDGVFFPGNKTGYVFGEFTSYGIPRTVSQNRDMSVNTEFLTEQGTLVQGIMTQKSVFEYPDAPHFEWPNPKLPTYSRRINTWADPLGRQDQAITKYVNSDRGTRVEYPDGSAVNQTTNTVKRNEHKVTLMSVSSVNDLVSEGRNLVVVAFVASALHIRIFNHDGERVVDKAENELEDPFTVGRLKNLLTRWVDQPNLPPWLSRDLTLDQQITYTGTSPSGSEGAYVAVTGSESIFTAADGAVKLTFGDFSFSYPFSYPSGPTTMALDIRFVLDGRGLPATRVDSGAPRRLVESVPALAAGHHTLRLEVRTVLVNGPPVNNARLTGIVRLAVTPPPGLPEEQKLKFIEYSALVTGYPIGWEYGLAWATWRLSSDGRIISKTHYLWELGPGNIPRQRQVNFVQHEIGAERKVVFHYGVNNRQVTQEDYSDYVPIGQLANAPVVMRKKTGFAQSWGLAKNFNLPTLITIDAGNDNSCSEKTEFNYDTRQVQAARLPITNYIRDPNTFVGGILGKLTRVTQYGVLADGPIEAPPPALSRDLTLDQVLAHTGTSVTGSEGAYVAVTGSESTFTTPPGGRATLTFGDFGFTYPPSGNTQMALDIRFVLDGRGLPATRLDSGAPRRLVTCLPELEDGSHTLRLEVRTVLVNGPAVNNVRLTGTARLGAVIPLVLVTDYHYDETGNLIKVQQGTGLPYDPFSSSPHGPPLPDPATQYLYEARTQYSLPSEVSIGSTDPHSPLHIRQRTDWDLGLGLPKSITDANGKQTVMTYESASAQWRLKTSTSPTGVQTRYKYADKYLSVGITVTDAEGGSYYRQLRYDGRGLLRDSRVQIKETGGHDITKYEYDVMGRLTAQTLPRRTTDAQQTPRVARLLYDHAGRLSTRTAPDGSTSRWFYNEGAAGLPPDPSGALGETVRTVDPWSRETWKKFDAFGRIRRVLEPNAQTGKVDGQARPTDYQRDVLGRLTQIRQGGQVHTFRYDTFGRLTAAKYPERTATLNDTGQYVGSAGTWSDMFKYDGLSNLVEYTDARGVKTRWAYNSDPLNRLQSIVYDTSAVGDTSSPIAPTPNVQFTYVGSGDLRRLQTIVTQGILREDRNYDSFGRLQQLSNTTYVGFPPASAPRFVTEYTYDSLNRVTSVKYPRLYENGTAIGDRTFAYNYSRDGDLTGVKLDGTPVVRDARYDPLGLRGLDLSLGTAPITEDYDYTPTGRIQKQTVTDASSSAKLLDLEYSYVPQGGGTGAGSETGQITVQNDLLNSCKRQVFQYDGLGRLVVQEAGPPGFITEQRYLYDAHGNRTHVHGQSINPCEPVQEDGLSFGGIDPSTNQILPPLYRYDAAGNLVEDHGISTQHQRYVYDAAGRLVRVESPSEALIEAYLYGPDRRRIGVSTNQRDWRLSIWDGNTELARYDKPESGGLTWREMPIYFGSRLLGDLQRSQEGHLRLFHPDHRGIALITRRSNNALASTRLSVLPFGKDRTAAARPADTPVFTTYERSDATGLDYAINRYYDPKHGRFLQTDPLGMGAFDLENPQSLNSYAYVTNDPVNGIDPLGLVPTGPCKKEGETIREGDWVYVCKDGKWVNKYQTTVTAPRLPRPPLTPPAPPLMRSEDTWFSGGAGGGGGVSRELNLLDDPNAACAAAVRHSWELPSPRAPGYLEGLRRAVTDVQNYPSTDQGHFVKILNSVRAAAKRGLTEAIDIARPLLERGVDLGRNVGTIILEMPLIIIVDPALVDPSLAPSLGRGTSSPPFASSTINVGTSPCSRSTTAEPS